MAGPASRWRFLLLSPALLVLLLSGASAHAQTMPAKPAGRGEKPKNAAAATATPKLNPEQERGLRLLKSSEGEAAGLAPDMHAFVLWRVAYAYKKIDPKKAEKIAADAFTATQAIEDPQDRDECGGVGSAGDIKSWIQQSILRDMVEKQKIAEAEQLLPQATEPVRNEITKQIVKHYVKEKDFAHAEALLNRLADSSEYPFDAAGDIILATGPELSADRMTVFTQALNNFEQHKPRMTLEAVTKLLDEAKSSDNKSHYSMASASGSVTLNSGYEMRLFQLLPVLEELDKDKAEELLRDNAEAKAKLASYPQGMQSLRAKGEISSFGVDDNDAPQAAEREAHDETLGRLQQSVDAVIKEDEKDPAQALEDALNLPLQSSSGFPPRARALMQIAYDVANEKPSVAKAAVNEILKFQDQLTPDQTAGLANLPELYMALGEEDEAKKVLGAVLKAAEKIYAHDTDADDPNKAFKGTWPSSDLWRKCVQVAAKISPALSEEIIANIPDPDIAAAQKVAFASSLLGATSGEPILVGDCRKTHSSFNTSN
jgi:hypothetical protein